MGGRLIIETPGGGGYGVAQRTSVIPTAAPTIKVFYASGYGICVSINNSY
jgi:N-methylhydantoinase B/oxoprolinase/acetone carboxylase alpha subunit